MNPTTPFARLCADMEPGFSAALGVPVRLIASRAWASVTFDGHRCRLTTTGDVDPSKLAETDFAVPGYIVADVEATEAADGTTQLDALLVRAA